MLVSSASINQTLLPITCYLVILISVNWLIIIIISLETELENLGCKTKSQRT